MTSLEMHQISLHFSPLAVFFPLVPVLCYFTFGILILMNFRVKKLFQAGMFVFILNFIENSFFLCTVLPVIIAKMHHIIYERKKLPYCIVNSIYITERAAIQSISNLSSMCIATQASRTYGDAKMPVLGTGLCSSVLMDCLRWSKACH